MSKSKYEQYTTVDYYGRKLLSEHSLDETGTWSVHGGDPNCDLGGYHHMPFLGYFEGRLEDVIRLAVELPLFWSWGGGEIKKNSPPSVVKVDKGSTAKLLKARADVEAAKKALAEAEQALERCQND